MPQPNQPSKSSISRRDFTKAAGLAAAATTLGALNVPFVHAADSSTIQIALVGCGGRGTGAAGNALSSTVGPTKVVAMADVFQQRLDLSHKSLEKYKDQLDVPNDRKFIGFDGYKHAIDCLKKGDIAIFATPLAFRWVHFKYAIEKGINVFMEKPLTADGPTTRRMIGLAEEASKKNLKVAVGLMCRHCKARKELYDRIRNGEIGEILNIRCYRMHGPVGHAFSLKKPDNISELLYQIREFHSFLWASGGLFSDFYIHNIDECCWMKNAWPTMAHGLGGRHYRGNYVDQNFDTYDVEYTFDDGTKMFLQGRTIDGCRNEFASYAHGTKGMAVISTNAHTPARCRIYKGQKIDKTQLAWAYPDEEPNPYQLEWDDLIDAIRQDKPYNEVKRGAEASLVTSMGRKATHIAQQVTLDDMMKDEHEFSPHTDQLTMDSPAPLPSDKD